MSTAVKMNGYVLAHKFNTDFPIGTKVIYFPGGREKGDPVQSHILSRAIVLKEVPCVFVSGYAKPINISDIDKIEEL